MTTLCARPDAVGAGGCDDDVLDVARGQLRPRPTSRRRFATPHPETLRCFDAQLMDLIQQGLARSGTLQELASHLERAGVIVFLSYGRQLPSNTAGRTRFMAASGGWRYLSTELSDRLSRLDLMALLAHELQHAVEIADAPEVVDEASLKELYRRLGADSGPGSVRRIRLVRDASGD